MKENFSNIKIHVAYVAHAYESHKSAKDLLKSHFTTLNWAKSLAQQGIMVSVFYRFNREEYIEDGPLKFYFFSDCLPPSIRSFHFGLTFNQKVAKIVQDEGINIIHSHNPYSILPNFVLRRLLPNIPMLIQDHSGNNQLSHPWLLRQMLHHVDAIVFSAKGQERPWIENHILEIPKVFFVMENSSTFSYMTRDASRQITGLTGKPIFLWVGNLTLNKDPFTMLAAFQKIAYKYPNARLHMVFRLNELQNEVDKYLQDHPVLQDRVTLHGAKNRESLEAFYNSSDFFISCSYKEGSGYALIEAMSCGVIPIVSDIPSFRELTGNGTIGSLYDAGNPEMLFDKIEERLKSDLEADSQRVLHHFIKNFSYEAIAIKMKRIYFTLISAYDSKK